MALFVCYHNGDAQIDWTQEAIYIHRSLYQKLVKYHQRTDQDTLLREVVSVSYGDDIFVPADQVGELLNNLQMVLENWRIKGSQVKQLLEVIDKAIETGQGLVFGGDMYPDLSATLR